MQKCRSLRRRCPRRSNRLLLFKLAKQFTRQAFSLGCRAAPVRGDCCVRALSTLGWSPEHQPGHRGLQSERILGQRAPKLAFDDDASNLRIVLIEQK